MRGRPTGGSSSGRALHSAARSSVTVVASPDSAEIGRQVEGFLSSVGLDVVELLEGADVAVLLLDQGLYSGLADLLPQLPDQLVVVRVAPVVGALPARIADINWVLWDAEHPQASLPAIAAAVHADHDRWAATKQLRAAAIAWEASGWQTDWLVDDPTVFQEFDEAARAVARERGPLEPRLIAFLDRSRSRVRSRRRRRRIRRATAVATIVLAVLSGLFFLPRIQAAGAANRQTLLQVDDPIMRAQLPGWTALLGGALMVGGTSDQQAIGRRTVLQTITLPWESGAIDVGPSASVEDIVPFSDPSRVVCIVRRGESYTFAVYGVRGTRLLWQLPLGGQYWSVALSPGDKTAAVSGSDGTVLIDVGSRRVVRRLTAAATDRQIVRSVWLSDHGPAVLHADGALEVPKSATGDMAVVRVAGAPIDLAMQPDGRLVVLSSVGKGQYSLTDGRTGAVIARAHAPAPLLLGGAVDRGGRGAYVLAGDHQLWHVGLDGTATPTGLPVTDVSTVMSALPADRLVIGGGSEPLHVYQLPSLVDLGEICPGLPRPTLVYGASVGDAVTCMGPIENVISQAPDGPMRTGQSGARPGTRVSHGLAVTDVGLSATISSAVAGWRVPSGLASADVRVVSFSPEGDQLALGTATGQLRLYTVGPGGAEQVTIRQLPVASAIRAITWRAGQPVVANAAGWWQVSGCPGCASDQGLLRLLVDRLSSSRCWTNRQLQFVRPETRTRLGLSVCPYDYRPNGGGN